VVCSRRGPTGPCTPQISIQTALPGPSLEQRIAEARWAAEQVAT
jgi:hypothetical protein